MSTGVQESLSRGLEEPFNMETRGGIWGGLKLGGGSKEEMRKKEPCEDQRREVTCPRSH